jgi:hypothetical protein
LVLRVTCTVREQSRLPRCFGGGSRTSKDRYNPADISALLPNASWLSCHVRPHQREVSPFARGVMLPVGATPIRPITGRPSLAPSSFTRCPMRSPCGSPSCEVQHRRTTGLPRSASETHQWFRSRLYAGGATSTCAEFGAAQPDHLPFGPSLSASLAWPL